MKNEGNRKLALTLIVLGIILSFFGGSLAYFNWETSESQKTAVAVTVTQDFMCTIDGGGTIESSNYQLIPTGCTDPEYAIQREVTISPTIYNTANNVELDMWIDVNTLNQGLSESRNFKYALTTSPTSCTSGVVSSGTFHDLTTNSQTEIILNRIYPQTMTETYYLYIWLDSIESNPDTMEQSFSLSLNGSCTNASKGEPYYVVYSETDNSLRFYDNEEPITEGSTYNNLLASKVYTAYENDEYLYNASTTRTTSPWDEKRDIVTKIVIEDEISPGSTAYWFALFTKVFSVDVTKLDTSNVTSMQRMFDRVGYDSSVTSFSIVGLDDFNTSNVKDMKVMFQCIGYNATTWSIGDLSNWNVSNVTDMQYMFNQAGSYATTWNIGDLSNWNVSNVTNTQAMFAETGRYNAETFNIGNLDNWNILNVVNMRRTFFRTGESAKTWNIGDLSNWNVSNTTNMESMFNGAGNSAITWNIGDLSNWNVSNVTNMYGMFKNAGYSATTFNIGNLDNWDVSNVTNMDSMFARTGYSASTFNIGNLNNWNTSKVTNMNNMFERAGRNSTTWNIGDLSNWNVSNVTNMSDMFSSAGYAATSWSIGTLDNWNVSKVTRMEGMFESTAYNAITFNIGDISQWNTQNVTNMAHMFASTGKPGLTSWSLDLSRWNVSNVTEYTEFNIYRESNVTAPIWVS